MAVLLPACSPVAPTGPTTATPAPAPSLAAGFAAPTSTATATVEPTRAIETRAPLTAAEAWELLISGEPEAVTHDSIAAIKAASSAVVVGRISAVVAGPDFLDEYGNVSHNATVLVDIEDVLDGEVVEAEPGRMKLRTVVSFGSRVRPNRDLVERLVASLPRERALFFVENVSERLDRMGVPPTNPRHDPEAYRVLGGFGFIRDVDGAAEPPAWVASRWPADLRGRPFDEVVAEIARS
jgi:hypothetical protein